MQIFDSQTVPVCDKTCFKPVDVGVIPNKSLYLKLKVAGRQWKNKESSKVDDKSLNQPIVYSNRV